MFSGIFLLDFNSCSTYVILFYVKLVRCLTVVYYPRKKYIYIFFFYYSILKVDVSTKTLMEMESLRNCRTVI